MRWCVLALPFLAGLSGCASQPPEVPQGKLVAAVTVLPHAWLVGQIGGPRVEVVALVKPGESAESYQPSDAQISQVARASVYFRTGMPLEESRGFEALRSLRSLKVVDLRQGIVLRELAVHHHHDESEDAARHDHDHTADHAGDDPHIWLSPRLLKVQARTVLETLAAIDPPHREEFEANFAALEKRLDAADGEIARRLAPHRGRALFVFHPAWGYFAADYGLRQIAIETEGKEPSDRELTELQEVARREKAKVIFVHPQSGRRSAEAMAQAIGGRVEVIDDLPADPPGLLDSLRSTAKLLAESFP
jgi:zinc transport system substrate-binding protein